MPRLATFIVLAFVAQTMACGDEPPPAPPIDSGTDALADSSTDVFDADMPDAIDDVGSDVLDSQVDSASDSARDSASDVGADSAPDTAPPDACSMITRPLCPEPPAECPRGTKCLDDGCGGTRCLPSAHACEVRADCPSGSDCVELPGGSRCFRLSGCGDSRDCAFGFACEENECVDRRVRCGTPPDVCPIGFTCLGPSDLGTDLTCVPIAYRCATDAACEGVPLFATCRDVDGDGAGECARRGECETSADCDGLTCAFDATFGEMRCTRFGHCRRDEDCNVDQRCVDLRGDGIGTCALPGECASNTECDVPQVCVPGVGVGRLQCWGEAI